MTTYIPHLTLPSVVFENPAASILLPIALGTAVGFSIQRKSKHMQLYSSSLTPLFLSQRDAKDLHGP